MSRSVRHLGILFTGLVGIFAFVYLFVQAASVEWLAPRVAVYQDGELLMSFDEDAVTQEYVGLHIPVLDKIYLYNPKQIETDSLIVQNTNNERLVADVEGKDYVTLDMKVLGLWPLNNRTARELQESAGQFPILFGNTVSESELRIIESDSLDLLQKGTYTVTFSTYFKAEGKMNEQFLKKAAAQKSQLFNAQYVDKIFEMIKKSQEQNAAN